MATHLVYLIGSNQYHVYRFRFLRVLAWLAAAHPGATLLLLSTFPLESLLERLPPPTRAAFVPLLPAGLRRVAGDEQRARYQAVPEFMHALFPGETIHFYDLTFPDRGLWFLRTVDGSDPVAELFSHREVSTVHLVGSATDDQTIAPELLRAAGRASGIRVCGYPLGNVVGRYAPFWLDRCETLYLEKPQYVDALALAGFPPERMELYRPPRVALDGALPSGGSLVLDVGLHSPRHDVVRCVQSLMERVPPERLLLFSHLQPSFHDLYARYFQAMRLPRVRMERELTALLGAAAILSFFPYAAYYLLEDLEVRVPTYVVDLGRRYSTVDGLRFEDVPVIADPMQLEEVPL